MGEARPPAGRRRHSQRKMAAAARRCHAACAWNGASGRHQGPPLRPRNQAAAPSASSSQGTTAGRRRAAEGEPPARRGHQRGAARAPIRMPTAMPSSRAAQAVSPAWNQKAAVPARSRARAGMSWQAASPARGGSAGLVPAAVARPSSSPAAFGRVVSNRHPARLRASEDQAFAGCRMGPGPGVSQSQPSAGQTAGVPGRPVHAQATAAPVAARAKTARSLPRATAPSWPSGRREGCRNLRLWSPMRRSPRSWPSWPG